MFAKSLCELRKAWTDDELFLPKPQDGVEEGLKLNEQMLQWEEVQASFINIKILFTHIKYFSPLVTVSSP